MKTLIINVKDEIYAYFLKMQEATGYDQDRLGQGLIELAYHIDDFAKPTTEVRQQIVSLTCPKCGQALQTLAPYVENPELIHKRRELINTKAELGDVHKELLSAKTEMEVLANKFKETIPPSTIYQGWTSGPRAMIANQLSLLKKTGVDVSSILQSNIWVPRRR
jgi:hypothetical protein